MNSLVPTSAQIAARVRSEREIPSDFTRTIVLLLGLAAVIAGSADRSLATELDPSIEEILIKGQDTGAADLFVVTPDRATPNAPDTTEMMQLVPGGGVVNNGPLSGQVQYRGMFGSRVGVRIDGMYISPGGPNWMDAPLHYAPRMLLESLTVARGVASVSAGAEIIGGSVHAKLKRSQFTEDELFSVSADAHVSGRTVDSSVAGGGILSLANDRHRFQLVGTAEVGDDMHAAAGRIVPTEFERYTYGGGYGVRLGEEHEVGVSYRHNDTGRTGNPALPMDIKHINTEIANFEYSGSWLGAELAASVYYMDIDHGMDNFGLRTPPASAARFRSTHATSDAFGYEAKASLPFYEGTLAFGTDGHLVDHDMDVSNPNNSAFFVRNFNDVDRDRYSLFSEWERILGERWKFELGVRYSLVHMDAGSVDALPARMLPPPQRLRDAFNAADHEEFDHLVDAVAKVSVEPWSGWLIELSGGRKTRAPSYVERYAWLPLQATAGLADGNNYVGDIGLDPEESYLVDLGVEWRRADFYIAPRAFYHWVDDYIQGVPSTNPDVIAVSTVGGDPHTAGVLECRSRALGSRRSVCSAAAAERATRRHAELGARKAAGHQRRPLSHCATSGPHDPELSGKWLAGGGGGRLRGAPEPRFSDQRRVSDQRLGRDESLRHLGGLRGRGTRERGRPRFG